MALLTKVVGVALVWIADWQLSYQIKVVPAHMPGA